MNDTVVTPHVASTKVELDQLVADDLGLIVRQAKLRFALSVLQPVPLVTDGYMDKVKDLYNAHDPPNTAARNSMISLIKMYKWVGATIIGSVLAAYYLS